MGTAYLAESESFDLDSGDLARPAGASGDVSVVSGGFSFGRPRRLLSGFDAHLPAVSRQPWSELRTKSGRLAAVQLLHAAVPFTFRYVVAPAGQSAWRSAPGNPRCIGSGSGIEIAFDERSEYANYRIDRRKGVDGPFETVGTVVRSPFADKAVMAGVRYGYRVIGLTSAGEQSVPAEALGTTESRGVFSGSALLFRFGSPLGERNLDLLRGVPDTETFDVRFVGAPGPGGLRVADFTGREAYSYCAPEPPRELPWDVPQTVPGWVELQRGESFFIDLRGGGVARCSFRYVPTPSEAPPQIPDIWLDYVVNPDGPNLLCLPRLSAARDADGRVRLGLTGPGGARLDEVEVRGADGSTLRRLPASEGPSFDVAPLGETYRVYAGAARIGPRGQRFAVEALLDERPAGARSGEITIGCYRGWSFAAGAAVPMEAADVGLSGFCGGITGVEVIARGGLASFGTLTGDYGSAIPVKDYYDAIAAVRPGAVALKRRQDADDRETPTEVFVVRCQSGGWAKIMLSARRKGEGDLRNSTVTFRYAFNPREPVFEESAVVQWRGGLGITRTFPSPRGAGAPPVK